MTNEKLNELKAQFFSEADILFWLWDKDLNLIDVNEATLKLFHFKKEDVIGKNICDISPDCKPSGRYDIYKEVIRTGKTFIVDEVKAHPSLGNLHFRLKAFKVGDGLGSVTQNITDLNETIDELETFIYRVSHDMRSPIASILGLMNLIDKELKDLDEAKHFFKIVKHQTEHLDTILQILLDTARIRKGEKTIHLINFKQIIDKILKLLESMQGFKEIRFEHKISVNQKFHSDKSLIISLFQNLIENAIKYKKDNINDAFIKISITDESEGVKITVADNGIGIPEKLHKEVFKMFFRATDKAHGSGLGLYTVNHTIKKLNGHIQLDSQEKIGTTFTIYLPNEKLVGKSK